MTFRTMAIAVFGFSAVSACSVTVPDFRPGATDMSEITQSPSSATARFEQALIGQGCVLNSTNSAAIMQEATLSRDDLGRAIDNLRSQGRGEINPNDSSFRLTTGVCALS